MDSSRWVGIAFVGVFHAVVIYFLITAFGTEIVAAMTKSIYTNISAAQKAQQKVVPPPPPKFVPPPPSYIPPPSFDTAPATAIRSNTAILNVTNKKPAPTAHHIVNPRLVSEGSCTPDYPSVSKDLEEEGSATVKFIVNPDGSVSNPEILHSSGHPRLDQALLAKVASCNFVPGTDNGQPAALPKTIKYDFVLEE
jgi:protein TonB